ncbi:unnamed protein product [Trifolium pratense]|uniref:Uncharacterized protein n=1 Tax=Trifolium pratense TaxID=57577 RepID=A0ACB0J5W7_TRIPR|nr:unnamed protein product [Trifolium pratense]
MKLSLSLLTRKRNLSTKKSSSTHTLASNNDSSSISHFFFFSKKKKCGICFESKTDSNIFKRRNSNSNGCNHIFCLDCISKYVTFQINNNLVNDYVTCPSPDCFVKLKAKHLQHILSKEIIFQWESLICQSSRSIFFKLKIYCRKLYQAFKLDKNFLELVKSEKWQRCPKCYFYVERKKGCNQIICRCGCAFCYNCGRKWGRIGHKCGIFYCFLGK